MRLEGYPEQHCTPAHLGKVWKTLDHAHRKATRLERNRATDRPLVALLEKEVGWVAQVEAGTYVANLPADVYKTLWVAGPDQFLVGTYKNANDRLEDLMRLRNG